MQVAESVPTDRAKAVVGDQQGRLAEEKAALARLEALEGDLGLAVDQGEPGAEQRRAKVRLELEAAQAAIAARTRSLKAAEAKHADALRLAKEAERENAWTQVEQLVSQRSKVASRIEKAAAELSAGLKELQDLDMEIYALMPANIKGQVAFSPAKDIVSLAEATKGHAIKEHLFKVGCKWGFPRFPWSEESVKSFGEQVENGSRLVLSFRPRKESA